MARAKQVALPTLIAAVVLLVPVGAWLASTPDPLGYFLYDVAPGQRLYVVSKLVGLVAFSFLWFQALTALAGMAPQLPGFVRFGRPLHRRLGLAIASLVVVHAGLFVAAVSVRSGHLALHVLVPKFDAGYYVQHVAFGILALGILLLAVVAGLARQRSPRIWRWVHRLWPVALVLAFLHGYGIGTETRFGPMQFVYVFAGVSLLVVLVRRLSLELRRRRARPGDGAAVTPGLVPAEDGARDKP